MASNFTASGLCGIGAAASDGIAEGLLGDRLTAAPLSTSHFKLRRWSTSPNLVHHLPRFEDQGGTSSLKPQTFGNPKPSYIFKSSCPNPEFSIALSSQYWLKLGPFSSTCQASSVAVRVKRSLSSIPFKLPQAFLQSIVLSRYLLKFKPHWACCAPLGPQLPNPPSERRFIAFGHVFGVHRAPGTAT
ncbi:hypothetical protein C8J57DRAFT_1235005 [Mycena rebaudengoi]|nr:hypothetical protein C8J57DRAFT_1235005 [Mycena rebaudengoi]